MHLKVATMSNFQMCHGLLSTGFYSSYAWITGSQTVYIHFSVEVMQQRKQEYQLQISGNEIMMKNLNHKKNKNIKDH